MKERQRRLEKEAKVTNCNKSRPDQVSAPLILDPTAGSLSKDIKEVANVQVMGRAGIVNEVLVKLASIIHCTE